MRHAGLQSDLCIPTCQYNERDIREKRGTVSQRYEPDVFVLTAFNEGTLGRLRHTLGLHDKWHFSIQAMTHFERLPDMQRHDETRWAKRAGAVEVHGTIAPAPCTLRLFPSLIRL